MKGYNLIAAFTCMYNNKHSVVICIGIFLKENLKAAKKKFRKNLARQFSQIEQLSITQHGPPIRVIQARHYYPQILHSNDLE